MRRTMMKSSNKLTMTDLWCAGFCIVKYDDNTDTWEIWKESRGKLVKIKITKAVGKHKYAPDKIYDKISYGYKGKQYSVTLARFLWAWNYGEIGADEYVGFKDENAEKLYALDNLVKKTREEVEKHKNRGNQYYSTKWLTL